MFPGGVPKVLLVMLCQSFIYSQLLDNAHRLQAYGIQYLEPPMKSTEVQTLGELRMRGTTNGWAGLFAFTRGLPLVACGESYTG